MGITRTNQGLDPSWKVRDSFSEVLTPHVGPDGGAGVGQMHHFSCAQPALPLNTIQIQVWELFVFSPK